MKLELRLRNGFLLLSIQSKNSWNKAGLAVYCLGTLIYFGSWLPLRWPRTQPGAKVRLAFWLRVLRPSCLFWVLPGSVIPGRME